MAVLGCSAVVWLGPEVIQSTLEEQIEVAKPVPRLHEICLARLS
jgi:hypothetical protein